MLRVDLRALDQGSIETAGRVAPNDPALGSLEFALAAPIDVRGRLMEAGTGRYFWDAGIRTTVGASCRRCLAPVTVAVDQPIKVLFTEDEGADDPASYAIPPGTMVLDLGEAVRQELILAVPNYVLCREGCRGMCPRCGADLNTGPCQCRPEADPRWAALEALRTARPDDDTR